ncbi:cyclophilin-like fold protein [soil metagenome]
MTRFLSINADKAELKAELDERPTSEEIWRQLPLEANANLWGDEIYFPVPVSVGPEDDAREVVEAGDVCYWPQGDALCIFFGPTPASQDEKPRAASSVTVVGRVVEGLDSAKAVASGETLRVEGIEQ